MIEGRHCLRCKAPFVVERLEETIEGGNKRKFCSKRCRVGYAREIRRRGNDWQEKRDVIILRDGKCVICGSKENLHVHHIERWSRVRSNEFSNLITLCAKDHALEDARMIRFHKPSQKVRAYMQKLKTTPSQTE